MNQMVAIGGVNAPLTMSSREIAELCGKLHKNVVRDIETMLAQITELNFEPSDLLSTYRDSTGRSLKEYRLPKDLTVTLITGYRADLRYKVVKRLEELEAERLQTPAAPAFRIPQNYEEALEAHLNGVREVRLLNAEKSALEVQVAAMVPAVATLERIAVARQSMTIRDAAKMLATVFGDGPNLDHQAISNTYDALGNRCPQIWGILVRGGICHLPEQTC